MNNKILYYHKVVISKNKINKIEKEKRLLVTHFSLIRDQDKCVR